jgi:hypothetical protein
LLKNRKKPRKNINKRPSKREKVFKSFVVKKNEKKKPSTIFELFNLFFIYLLNENTIPWMLKEKM